MQRKFSNNVEILYNLTIDDFTSDTELTPEQKEGILWCVKKAIQYHILCNDAIDGIDIIGKEAKCWCQLEVDDNNTIIAIRAVTVERDAIELKFVKEVVE